MYVCSSRSLREKDRLVLHEKASAELQLRNAGLTVLFLIIYKLIHVLGI